MKADVLAETVCRPRLGMPYPTQRQAPIETPASTSPPVIRLSDLWKSTAARSPAARKRTPMKNHGPECCTARWTTTKVAPHTAVIATRAASWGLGARSPRTRMCIILHTLGCRMMHMSNESTPVLAHLATNVRRLRRDAGISQATLAERAGISRRTVIALEAGDANIGLTSVDRLADALGTTFTDLVKTPATSRTNIEEILWRGQAEASSATLLGSAPASTEAQLWTWRLAPDDRYDAQPDPAGWHEIILVTAGLLRIELKDGPVDLAPGQRVIYPSDQQYSYIALGDTPVEFTRIVTS